MQLDLVTTELFFELRISQRYIQNWNWKSSVCNRVNNFAKSVNI